MTLKLAETSVLKSRPSVPYEAIFFKFTLIISSELSLVCGDVAYVIICHKGRGTKFWCGFPLESFQWQANLMDPPRLQITQAEICLVCYCDCDGLKGSDAVSVSGLTTVTRCVCRDGFAVTSRSPPGDYTTPTKRL